MYTFFCKRKATEQFKQFAFDSLLSTMCKSKRFSGFRFHFFMYKVTVRTKKKGQVLTRWCLCVYIQYTTVLYIGRWLNFDSFGTY